MDLKITVTPFQAYVDFLAVRNHFNVWEYDYFRYQGQVANVSQDEFDMRPDRMQFDRIARHHNPHWLIVSNLAEDPKLWARDIADGNKAYIRRIGTLDSFSYRLPRELALLDPAFDSNFIPRNGRQPNLVRLYLGKQISLEVASALATLTGATGLWLRSPDPFLNEIARRFFKYSPFVFSRIDKEMIREKIIEYVKNTVDM